MKLESNKRRNNMIQYARAREKSRTDHWVFVETDTGAKRQCQRRSLVLIVDNIPFRGDFAGALVAAAVFDALVAFLTGALVALVAAALATV